MHGGPLKGRGAASNRTGRFESLSVERVDDGWGSADEELPPLATTVQPEPAHSVITRNNSPDIPFDLSVNPYRGCEHGCVYCVSGDTQVLMASGAQRPIAELSPGDEIYGTVRSGFHRRFVRTTVSAHWRTSKPAWRVRLADGTALVASADHRFLTERGWKFVAKPDSDSRVRRSCLTPNDTLVGFGLVPPAIGGRQSSEFRRGYLCGLIRGDGHLGACRYARPGRVDFEPHRFRLAMADGAALDRASDFLSAFGIATDRFLYRVETSVRRRMEAIRTSARASVAAIGRLIEWPARAEGEWARGFVSGIFDAEGSFDGGTIRVSNMDPRTIGVLTQCLGDLRFDATIETPRRGTTKPVHSVRIRGGMREHLRLIGTFNPSIGRQRALDGQAVECAADLQVVEIEPLGRRSDLFDITSGTGDFVANGVISHNCYARPSHQYLNLSAGLDFETRLFYKKDAAAHLREELNRKSYVCSPINLGANTDPYQPLERKLRVTRSILEVLAEARHPVTVVTKGALVTRDIDLLGQLAAEHLVKVFVSLTTLDDELKRRMEPRAASPKARLAAIGQLAAAGIPTGVMYAPVVPAINDHELEAVLEAAAAQGAGTAGYVLLRLPGEVKDLFYEWLELHYPDRVQKVHNRIRELRGGRDNDARFGHRMRGQGTWAALLRSRFDAGCRRHGLGSHREAPLTTALFRPPRRSPDQMDLW